MEPHCTCCGHGRTTKDKPLESRHSKKCKTVKIKKLNLRIGVLFSPKFGRMNTLKYESEKKKKDCIRRRKLLYKSIVCQVLGFEVVLACSIGNIVGPTPIRVKFGDSKIN